MKKFLFTSIVFLSGIIIPAARGQDHAHLYVGATGTNQGDQLVITNAADFSTASGYVKTLNYTNGGPYAGYFEGNITFQANSAYDIFGDPVSGSAALGSWIHAQIVSVQGPSGGIFGFWEVGATNPTINVPCGTNSTNTWFISNNNDVPGTDPFGHIHGRRFTASKPGIYVVGFKAVDRSTNGANGGPIHADSEVVNAYFQAGINIFSALRNETSMAIRFGSVLNQNFNLESCDDLTTTNWTAIGTLVGNDKIQILEDTNSAPEKFYRIRMSNIQP